MSTHFHSEMRLESKKIQEIKNAFKKNEKEFVLSLFIKYLKVGI